MVARATGMPDWVSGVANSARGEIIIARHGPDGSPTELESLLRHEMVHVAMHRAVGGAETPRWFREGVAESIADEIDFGRAEALAGAVFGGGVPDRKGLERSFYGDGNDANVAYAAARDFVTFLRYHDPEGAAFRNLLMVLRHGETFGGAFERSYGASLDDLDREWRGGLAGRFIWFPLLGSGSLPMLLVTPAIAWAWMRKRKEFYQGLRRLEDEEKRARTMEKWMSAAT